MYILKVHFKYCAYTNMPYVLWSMCIHHHSVCTLWLMCKYHHSLCTLWSMCIHHPSVCTLWSTCIHHILRVQFDLCVHTTIMHIQFDPAIHSWIWSLIQISYISNSDRKNILQTQTKPFHIFHCIKSPTLILTWHTEKLCALNWPISGSCLRHSLYNEPSQTGLLSHTIARVYDFNLHKMQYWKD